MALASRSFTMSAAGMPHSARTSSVCWPGCGGGRWTADGVRAQLGVELRLDRADRDVLRVRRLVDVVEVGAGVEQVRAPLLAPDADGAEAVEHGAEHRGAVNHGGVDHLALAGAGGLDQRAGHAEGEEHAAAAEVANQVEGRHGRPAPAPD